MSHRIFFIFRALRFIVKLWVYPKVRFVDRQEIAAAGKKKCSVCYVIRSRSLLDAFMLDWLTRKFKLPVINATPKGLVNPRSVSLAYLIRLGLFRQNRDISPPTSITTLIQNLESNPELEDIWMIPVTTIWGLGPDSKSVSWFRLLFADDQRAGIFQKLLISFVNGRSTYIEVGRKVSLKEQLEQSSDSNELARKMRRIFRVHFQRVRTQVIGPETVPRHRVVRSVLRTPALQQAIEESAASSGASHEKIEKSAKKSLYQISADQQFSTVRFCEMILDWAFRKLFHKYEVFNANQVREISKTHEIVYLPCHKSHLDYLLLSFLTHKNSLPPPYIGAGENLNFFPIGGVLRRGGAFFLRRKFKGDKVYSTAFNSYLRYLLEKRFHIAFFLEGGRTRTGRLMHPKTGMLSMVLRNSKLATNPKIAFIPLYIGYDRVPEIRTYLKELSGASKVKESFFGFLKVWKIFEKDYGNTYFNFGSPITLEGLDQDNLVETTNSLAKKVMKSIGESSILSAMSLLSFILLADTGDQEESGLLKTMENAIYLAKKTWEGTPVIAQTMSAKEIIGHGRSMRILHKISIGNRTYYRGSEDYHLLLRFYRNEALHLFMIPGLVAHYLTQCDSPNYADLKRSVCAWIELFGDDFHLHSDASYTQDRLDGFLNGLHTLEFLHFGDERIQIEQKMQGSGRLKKIAKFSAGARQFYANVLDSLNGLEKLDERTLEAKLSAVAESIHEDNPGSESSTFQKFFSIEKNLESWTEKEILDKSGRLTPHGKQLMQAARILA